jgi:hypothetical protein
MATTMTEAVYDLVELNPDAVPTPAELWDRFMAWLDRVRSGALRRNPTAMIVCTSAVRHAGRSTGEL